MPEERLRRSGEICRRLLARPQFGAARSILVYVALETAVDTRPILDILLFNRNPNMARQIKGFLDQGETYFVVLGAAHLIGKGGVVELLKNEGFKVDQL